MRSVPSEPRAPRPHGTPPRASLAAIYVYPVKSAAGIALDAAELDAFGLRHDRRWLVVDPAGRFMTQRRHPRLALIRSALGADTLTLDAPGMPTLALPLEPPAAATERVRIWSDDVDARSAGDDAARWVSAFLGTPCRLVYMPDSTVREVSLRYGKPGDRVAFQDAYPLLLLSEQSLAVLNARLAEPLPVNRFRPNLVIRGAAEAHAEDAWRRIRVGAVELDVVKPCARCAITTVDQATGRRDGKEPLRTLATYRRGPNGGVLFGMNAIHRARGTLRVGDAVEVLDEVE
ncbi:MAG TPA: MOSC N-terminal beta barrel domain-containing protein [Longimicrobiales bacterium]